MDQNDTVICCKIFIISIQFHICDNSIYLFLPLFSSFLANFWTFHVGYLWAHLFSNYNPYISWFRTNHMSWTHHLSQTYHITHPQSSISNSIRLGFIGVYHSRIFCICNYCIFTIGHNHPIHSPNIHVIIQSQNTYTKYTLFLKKIFYFILYKSWNTYTKRTLFIKGRVN